MLVSQILGLTTENVTEATEQEAGVTPGTKYEHGTGRKFLQLQRRE